MGLDHERMNTLTAKLSGGEKARLLLGLCTFHGPDILILDEPTNHLDMGAREALVHAINEFSGAVILVSHDRHLIDATTERLWIVRDGTVSPYEEDLATYRKEVLQTGRKRKDQLVAAPEPEPASPPATQQLDYDERRELSERRRKLAPLKQKISEKEYKIQKLDEDISKLDSALLEPGLYENNPDKAARISKMRASAEKQKDLLEEEWLSLSDEYEAGLVAKPA
jgi:ATP-binding cassette subfamily F protein 3